MTKPTTTLDKVLVFAGAICILLGFAGIMHGEWTTGIGTIGVLNKIVGSVGFAIFGIGVFAIGLWMAREAAGGFSSMSRDERVAWFKKTLRQLAGVFLNIVVYGGLFILVMGGISALDGANAGTVAVVVVTFALCVGAFVLFRRYRKSHRVDYKSIGNVFLVVLLGLVGVTALVASLWLGMPAAIADLAEGPKTADVVLIDADTDIATGRYRAFQQPDEVLTFVTPSEERIVLIVPATDLPAVKKINDFDNFVHLTYYPRTQVFYDAESWPEGPEKIGALLMNRIANGELDP